MRHLEEEGAKLRAQRDKLAQVCSELKGELSVLRKRDGLESEAFYQERIEELEGQVEELELMVRGKERPTREQPGESDLIIEGDHFSMVQKEPNTPQRLHYKGNSAKATPS